MSKSSLEKLISVDVLYQVRLRSRLLAAVVVIIIGGILANGFLYNHEFYKLYTDAHYFYIGLALLLMLAVRGVAITFVMPKIFERMGGKLPMPFRYFNVLFEVTVPSIVIALLAGWSNPINILASPIVEIYFLFILLSVLEMDFKLSLFAGVVAGIEYFMIAFFYMDQIQIPVDLPFFNPPLYYLGRSLIIILAGIVAGKTGSVIRKRVVEIYEEREKSNKIERLFGQQLSPEVARELIDPQANLESKSHMVCIMFLDIRGFTSMMADKTPKEISEYQNAIFPFMIELIYSNHGIINQLLGDGFMATFGAPVSVGNDSQNAVDAATGILEALKMKNAENELYYTEVGIGLHYGQVVTGNVGSELRKQYSVTGQAVIISSRIEELNKAYGSTFLISKEVYRNLDRAPKKAMNLGPVYLKGLDTPIEIIRLN